VTSDGSRAALDRLRSTPVGADGLTVVGQLGQSLDGRIATRTGHSHYINGPAALDHLHSLRAWADAVVIGVGTAIADDPALTTRRVVGQSPARVVIDPTGRLPPTARLLARDGVRVLALRAEGAPDGPPGAEVLWLARRADGRLAPATMRRALAAVGFQRLLIEGGATTVSAFLAAEALDRLHVLIAPLIIGSGVAGFALPPIDRLDEARRPLASVMPLASGEALFDLQFENSIVANQK
jgi:riboflavin-specific deaminase-like protein